MESSFLKNISWLITSKEIAQLYCNISDKRSAYQQKAACGYINRNDNNIDNGTTPLWINNQITNSL